MKRALGAALALGLACPGVAGDLALSIAIGDLEFPGGIRLHDIRLACPRITVDAGGLACTDGEFTAARSPLGTLRVPVRARHADGAWRLSSGEFRFAGGSLRVALDIAGAAGRLRLALRDVELSRLAALAGAVRPALAGFEPTAGRADLDLDCEFAARRAVNCRAQGLLERVDVAGSSSAEQATLRFDLGQHRTADGQRWRGELALAAGTLYVEPGLDVGELTPGFLLRAGEQPVAVAFDLVRRDDGELRVHHCRLQHPGVADFSFDGDATLAPRVDWRDGSIQFSSPALDGFYATWLQPLLLGSALGDLSAQGHLDVALRRRAGALVRMDVDCRDCAFADAQGRYAVNALNGGLRLHSGADALGSSLSWGDASVYRIALGGGRVDWSSSRGRLAAVGWRDVAIFDGALRLDAVELLGFGSADPQLVLAGRIAPITLSRLTAAFGWPPLAGQLLGNLPRLTIARHRISVDGDLEIGVFGGQVLLRDLRLTDFLSAAPRLRTEVDVRGLDLSQLTGTFSFGRIDGHLDGAIRDLWLEAWQPVAFDAYFATPADDDLPHRISRQAVNNLSKLGAGTGGPLASGWLSLIPSYSYGELGLGCRLINGVCHLRGVEALPDGGFRLLTRGGLLPPWIEIRGASAQIAWQGLVDGMRRIAEGEVEFDVDVGRLRAP
jgi:hypothetical protein